jgi:hypothetical protein
LQGCIQAVLGHLVGVEYRHILAQPVHLSDSAPGSQPGLRVMKCAASNSAVECSAQEASHVAARLRKNKSAQLSAMPWYLKLTDSAQAS